MIQLTANLWNGIIAFHLPDRALARKYHECVSMAETMKYNVNDSPQKTVSLSVSHSSCFPSSTHPQNHFNLPHPWVICQRLNMPTQHFRAEAFSTFNTKLSHSLSPIVWLYGAPGREGEVERCWVSTWKEEHPNCGSQWGSVCPVPGCWLLAPGLLQRWSRDGDGFLQHKHHGWDGRNLYWKNVSTCNTHNATQLG